MSAVSPITRQTVGRTFIVAISALGVGAVAQLVVLGWVFYSRFRTTPLPESPAGPTPAIVTPAREFTDPFEEPATAVAAPARPAMTPPPKPTPIPQPPPRQTAEATVQDRFNELVEQARMLRERGDTYAAVTRLREAQAMDEKNPLAPAELALTYEKMGFIDRASESWRKVYDMGEVAGIYYAAADGRLKASQAQALKQAQGSLPAPATPTPTSTVSAPAALSGEGETVGLGPTSKLGLGELKRRDQTDPAASQKFTLEVPIRAKARARIDVREMIVQVQFFDVVNGRTLDRTSAVTNYKWAAPPADWGDGDVETLEVTYALPAMRVADEERKYYGYIASVYYKNALQDFRSDPPALAQRAPPPPKLAPESSE